ncbi:MAG TPA: AglZ/HisF2 family acetamidino modification protein [Afipia sp.]
MPKARVIPSLLLRGAGLVKTRAFKDPKYVGDPINAIRIFNDKEVDELVLLDITASVEEKPPAFGVIRDIASECFMPVAYGGGITSVDQIRQILAAGIEKVVVNSVAFKNPQIVRDAVREFGSQAVVVSIDVKRKLLGRYEVFVNGGRKAIGQDPVTWAKRMEEYGAGEIFLTSIDRDGAMQGYDLDLTRQVASAVRIPVIASGGAGSVADFRRAVNEGGAAAAAAGAMFVFHGPHRAVLITYPTQAELRAALG